MGITRCCNFPTARGVTQPSAGAQNQWCVYRTLHEHPFSVAHSHGAEIIKNPLRELIICFSRRKARTLDLGQASEGGWRTIVSIHGVAEVSHASRGAERMRDAGCRISYQRALSVPVLCTHTPNTDCHI